MNSDGDTDIVCSARPRAGTTASGPVGPDCDAFRAALDSPNVYVLPEGDLRGCDLRGLSVTAFDFSKTNFSGADLRGVKLKRSTLVEANFSEADLEGANLSESAAFLANFDLANLSHANLRSSDFAEVQFRRSLLIGANLERARDFDPVDVNGPIYGDTICPDGSNSFDEDGDDGTCQLNEGSPPSDF